MKRRLYVRYIGEDHQGWRYGENYLLIVTSLGRRYHIGTVASHNRSQGVIDPTPLRLRTLRQFFDRFIVLENQVQSLESLFRPTK